MPQSSALPNPFIARLFAFSYGAKGLVTATFVQRNWEGQIYPDFLFLWSKCSFQQADQNVMPVFHLCQN